MRCNTADNSLSALCLVYKTLPHTAVTCGERQTSDKVAEPVTLFVHPVTPLLSPIVKGTLAGRAPLICSRAVIIGPLRSSKDTQ